MLHLALLLLTQAAPQVPAPPSTSNDPALVVHGENPTESLTSAQLRHILRAEVREWPRHDTIELFLPRSGTPAKQVLLDRVYKMTDLQLKQYWMSLVYQNKIVDTPRSAPSSAVALRMIERTRGSLSIMPIDDVRPEKDVKVLDLDGHAPGERDYPLRSVLLASEDQPPTDQASAKPTEASAPLPEDTLQDARQQEILDRLEALEDRSSFGNLSTSGLPPLNLRVFGHAEFEMEDVDSKAGDETETGFSIEVLDLLMTSQLSDRFSILTETVIQALDDGDYDIEIARLLVNYRQSDALRVEMGRYLSSIGYWNTRYHHGEWLQTSIDRPEVLDFEDDGGLLPIHGVGVAFKGGFYGDAGGIDYALEISNGRGPTPGDVQIKFDANDPKAVNLSIGVEPAAIPGLRVGGGAYLDKIPRNDDPGEGQVHGSLDETILNAYAAYNSRDWEIMGEVFGVEHEDSTGTTADSSGWYTQFGRHFGAWTPYVRLDGIRRDDADPYFDSAENGLTRALGLRWDPIPWLALTVQYERADIDAPPGDPNERTETGVIQVSFTF